MAWPNPAYTRWLGISRRATVESAFSINIHRIAKPCAELGIFQTGSLHWTREGQRIASISYSIEPRLDRRMTLRLKFNRNGKPVDQWIGLHAKQCRFGGLRWFASCPQTSMSVANIHLPKTGNQFLSRRAAGLGYKSQCEPPIGRTLLKRNRLLDEFCPTGMFCPQKPNWMRWATYNKKITRLFELDAELDACLDGYAARLR